jgi:DNA-binding NarL/FixJ family response regulator
MPMLSGNEILQIIKDTPTLHGMKVVVLSAFDPKAQMTYSYDLYDAWADAYLVKPSTFDKRVEMLKELCADIS